MLGGVQILPKKEEKEKEGKRGQPPHFTLWEEREKSVTTAFIIEVSPISIILFRDRKRGRREEKEKERKSKRSAQRGGDFVGQF